MKIFVVYRGFYPSFEKQLYEELFFPVGYEIIKNIVSNNYKIDIICYKGKNDSSHQQLENLNIIRVPIRKNFPGEIWT
ncbi:MAG TPA: hypothetical protein P5150_05610, partial [Candidatus Ratteibacteria bacterium]|nr:hypothetical protein [Candidatus Ratteibacteria bacterium]